MHVFKIISLKSFSFLTSVAQSYANAGDTLVSSNVVFARTVDRTEALPGRAVHYCCNAMVCTKTATSVIYGERTDES